MAKSLRYLPSLSLLLLLLAACSSTAGIFSSGAWQTAGLSRQHIRAFAVDPNNPQNIYAGDTQDGVFASSDGGQHWKQRSAGLTLGSPVSALAFDDPGKKLYAATSAGLFASTSGAQTWAAVPGLPSDAVTALAFDLNTPQTIFAGTQQHGVLLSRNGGTSWSAINSNLPDTPIDSLVYDPSARQLWAGTNLGVYRTGDDGANWQSLNAGLPPGSIVYDVLPAENDGGTAGQVFVGTNQGFFLSQDNGAHWTTSQSALLHLSIYAVLIDTQTSSTLYLATDRVGVLRSSDNGQSWGSVASGLPRGQPVYALAQGATNDGQLFAASNDIYSFPGNSSALDPSRILPLLLAIAFFYLLYRLSTRGRKNRRDLLKPERIIEPEDQQTSPRTPGSQNMPPKQDD